MKVAVAVMVFIPVCALAQDEMHRLSDPALINGIALPYQLRGPGRTCGEDIRNFFPPKKFGTTVISYKVAMNGSVKDLTLEESSGSDTLDRRIMKCAAAARFHPATKDGQVVEYPEKIRYDWSWKLGR